MAYTHLFYESIGQGKELSGGSVQIELILGPLNFVFSQEDREKGFLLDLLLGVRIPPDVLPRSTASLRIVWKEAKRYYFDVYDSLEDIPPIEERSSVGTLKELLGVVLSERARLHRGARNPL